MAISQQQLSKWAEVCLRINYLNTLVQREIDSRSTQRAAELSERARVAAWDLFNELVASGAEKPRDFQEPAART